MAERVLCSRPAEATPRTLSQPAPFSGPCRWTIPGTVSAPDGSASTISRSPGQTRPRTVARVVTPGEPLSAQTAMITTAAPPPGPPAPHRWPPRRPPSPARVGSPAPASLPPGRFDLSVGATVPGAWSAHHHRLDLLRHEPGDGTGRHLRQHPGRSTGTDPGHHPADRHRGRHQAAGGDAPDTYPQPPFDGGLLSSAACHGRPGPAQVTLGSPSPGSNTSRSGRMVARAQTAPAAAVLVNGCQV